jgi:hypothetical protein
VLKSPGAIASILKDGIVGKSPFEAKKAEMVPEGIF